MSETLSPFLTLPSSYIVLDTETTGLADEVGPPGIVTLGLTEVQNQKISKSIEFKLKPYRSINEEAQKIHGITNAEADKFASLESKWSEIKGFLDNKTIVIHNASFDWPIILFHIDKLHLSPLDDTLVFCSQKSSIPFATEHNIPMSSRGPSLDSLSEYLGITSLRVNGLHGAEIDTRQTAMVVERLRELAGKEQCRRR